MIGKTPSPKEEPQETSTEVEETETNEDIVEEEEVINQTDTIEPTKE